MATTSKVPWHQRNKAKVRKSNKDYYARNKAAIAARRKQKRQEERVKRMVTIIKGREIRLYTLKEFCNLIGKATSTVKLWELRKVTPPPIFSNEKHQRLYSQEEVDLYDEVLSKHDRDLEALSDAIWKGIAALKEELDL